METTEQLLKKYGLRGMNTSGETNLDDIVSASREKFVQSQTVQPVEKEKTGFFAGGKVGEAIGTAIANRKLTPEAIEQFGKMEGPSAGEVIGDIGRGILEVAGFKGVGLAKTLLSTVAKSSALGAGLGATTEMSRGGDTGDILKAGLQGSAIGAGTAGVLGGVGSALKAFSNTMPQRLIQSAIKQTKPELRAGKDLTEYMLENTRFGTTNQLMKTAQQAIDKVDNSIDTILKNNKTLTSRQALIKIASVGENITSQQLKPAEVLKIVLKTAPNTKAILSKKALTLQDVNKLRSTIDKSLGGKAFLTPKLANNKEITMQFVNNLREYVKTQAPKTRKLFETYSKEITLRNAIESVAETKGRNAIVGMGDLISAGIGGASIGPAGVVAGIAGRRITESTLAKTGLAVAIDKLDTALTPILLQLDPAIRTQIIEAIGNAIEDNTN